MKYNGLLDILVKINEDTYKQATRKQKSITRLFPPFYDRVKAVANNGGVKLEDVDIGKGKLPDTWHFKIASGTKPDLDYDVVIKLKDIDKVIERYAKNSKYWNKAKTKLDLRKIGKEMLYAPEIEVKCSCPADLYYGGQYIRTQRGANYGEPENRPPKIRNPKQYGFGCKHLQLLFDVWPFYSGTMASYLKKYYGNIIDKTENESRKNPEMISDEEDEVSSDFENKLKDEIKKSKDQQDVFPSPKDEEVEGEIERSTDTRNFDKKLEDEIRKSMDPNIGSYDIEGE